MQEGLYEQLINQLVKEEIDALDKETFYAKIVELDIEESVDTLALYLQAVIKKALGSVEGNNDVKVSNRIALSNKIDLDKRIEEITPYTRLVQSELFTGGSAGIDLGSEIGKEILSADRIDFLVSFIKWKGIRIFEQQLQQFVGRGGKIRFITTTYMGASEAKAVEFLSNLPNTEVKVSYNTGNERLHAKAYLFYRRTGFHTAYIGSSNFSRSALTDGLEWNLKVTSKEISHIIDKFQKTFEAYWQSPEFEIFDPEKHLPKLKDALKGARIGAGSANWFSTFFDLTPHDYQKVILDQLEAERSIHGNFKNLIIAATGTGKTIVSAFEVRNGPDKKHRKARSTFSHLFSLSKTESRPSILRKTVTTTL